MPVLLFLLHAADTMINSAGDAIVSAIVTFECLWHNYGEVVRYRTRKCMVFYHTKLPGIAEIE